MRSVIIDCQYVKQRCTNPRYQVTWVTKFCKVTFNI